MTLRPNPNLPPESMPWARAINRTLDDVETSLRRTLQDSGNTNKQTVSTMNLLSQQVASLEAQATVVQDTMGGTGVFPQGWYSGVRPTVIASSPSGRIEVAWSVVAPYNEGVTATFSASGGISLDRTNMELSPNVVSLGSSSSTEMSTNPPSSGYMATVVNVLPNVPTTFVLEIKAAWSRGATVLAGLIRAKALP